MDTVRILDHYRFSLVHDATATGLLARLIREGPESEGTIASTLKSDIRRTRLLLNDLFRAALIERVGTHSWTASRLAEEILAQLHVPELASKDIIAGLDIDPADQRFLSLWVSAPVEPEVSRTRLSLLKCSAKTRAFWPFSSTQSTERDSSLVYSVLCATEPPPKATEADEWALWLDDSHRTAEARRRSAQASGAKSVVDSWRVALEHYAISNRILLFIDDTSRPRESDERAWHLTLIRGLSAAMLGNVDRGLLACTRQWQGAEYDLFWRRVLERGAVAERVRGLADEWIGAGVLSDQDLYANLAARLRAAVETDRRSKVDLIPSGQAGAVNPTELEWLAAMVRSLARRIRAPSVGAGLSQEGREALIAAISDLQAVVDGAAVDDAARTDDDDA